jgi:hypothetical protein
MASRLQQQCLNKAVATILALFAAHNSRQRLTLFRIHRQQTKKSFVRTVPNAKHELEGRSQIRDLARGLSLQLGNLACPTILYGLASLEFVPDFAGKASAHPPCMRSSTSPGASALGLYRFIGRCRCMFLQILGFEVLGPALDWAPGQTMDDSDVVLRRILLTWKSCMPSASEIPGCWPLRKGALLRHSLAIWPVNACSKSKFYQLEVAEIQSGSITRG